MNRPCTRRALLAATPALLLAGCGGSDSDSDSEVTELPLQFVPLTLAGLHDVPTGTYLFRQASDASDFLARYENPVQLCNSGGTCVPGHSPPPIELETQRYAVAGLCAGASGTCESMMVKRLRLRGDTAMLDYQLSRPDPGAGIVCPAVVTWMTAFVLVPTSVRQVEMVRV